MTLKEEFPRMVTKMRIFENDNTNEIFKNGNTNDNQVKEIRDQSFEN